MTKIDDNKFRTRLAPSPSSKLHLGNVASFLITWAFARKNGGRVIFRMDDLDQRCKSIDLQEEIISELRWLGIDWDGKIEYQSQRLSIYDEYFNLLKSSDMLYPCFCSRADLHASLAPHESDKAPIYSGRCKNLTIEEIEGLKTTKSPAYRIEIKGNPLCKFTDVICGEFSQDLKSECGDFVLKRSDSVYSYQLTSVVDDLEMGVTHVIRGNDLLDSTPRQIYLYNVLSALERKRQTHQSLCSEAITSNSSCPVKFAHHPLFLNSEGKRLAKRDGDKTIDEMRKEGATPEDIIGKVAFCLGLLNKEARLSKEEFADAISFEKLRRSSKKITVSY